MEKFPSLDKFYTNAVGGVGDNYEVCFDPFRSLCSVALFNGRVFALIVDSRNNKNTIL